jgi:hypothetical protein
VPPTLKYVLAIVDILKAMRAANPASKSSPARSPQKIVADLEVSEPAKISEVIPYFNNGLYPNAMVIKHMNRFMLDAQPRFANSAETPRAAA